MLVQSLALLAVIASAETPARPSVAVFRLNPEFGVAQGVANLMGERVASLLRDSEVFGRVVTSADLESLVDLERQKQMANCSADSCVSELAGALGVEYLVAGSLGKLGSSFLINLKLIDVRKTATVSAISERLTGATEEALLEGSLPAVRKLLDKSGLKHSLRAEEKALVTASVVAPPATPTPVDTPTTARPAWVFPLLGAGAGLVGLAAVGALAALAGGVMTAAFAVYNLQYRDYRPFLELGKDTTRQTNLITIYVLMGGVSAFIGLLALALGVAGGIGAVVAAIKV